MNNKSVKKKSKTCHPLSQSERTSIYMEIMVKLINLKIWDINDAGMQKFKIIMKSYLDGGREESGELKIDSINKLLIYHFYNDRLKKTVVYLSNSL